MDLTNIAIGQQLPEMKKTVMQEHILLYAKASHDFNPIHIDPDFARTTALGGTVAHGMLVLAYISQFMSAAFGIPWLTGGKLDIRFKEAARPGDNLTVNGNITKIDNEGNVKTVRCDIACKNQDDKIILSGQATVTVV
jgi:3-hydroxybutyryl-CoA dehydratase